MSVFSQIACETCRTKKRKCDRNLPSCSQCANSSLDCTYPETSKRGLPSGYIATLEKRLAQTEGALLQALAALHAPDHRLAGTPNVPATSDTLTERQPDREFNEIRSAKVEEWRNYPLGTEEQQKRWLRLKTGATVIHHGHENQQFQASPHSPVTETIETSSRVPSVAKRRKMEDTTYAERDGPTNQTDHQGNITVTPGISETIESGSQHGADNAWPEDIFLHTPYPAHVDQMVPEMQKQQTNGAVPDSFAAFVSPQSGDLDISNLEDMVPKERQASKAKKLSSLHSRKYF